MLANMISENIKNNQKANNIKNVGKQLNNPSTIITSTLKVYKW